MKLSEVSQKSDSQFLIDGMLGSLARKLRILGFDAWYDSKSTDIQLLRSAKKTNRWLVTSDIELYFLAKRRGTKTILIRSRSQRDILFEVLSRIGLSQISNNRTARCSVCNGILADSGRMNKDEPILSCSDCGKDFWKGSHWKRMSKLFDDVNRLLMNKSQKVGS
ncbi:MAG: hypothetical protein JRN15_21090 [Nitrososphaerota archaeon]|nr:hypothetical protein [Nitrososphaerota archaeon]